MTGKNTRWGRGRYNADYAPDRNGNYHYIGSRFRVDLQKEQMRGLRILLIVQTVALIAAFALGGLSNGITGRTLYALIPFVCCFLPLGYLLMGLVKWLFTKEDLTRKGMDESIVRMKHSAAGIAVCAALALIGGGIVCAVKQVFVSELCFLISAAALLALSLLMSLKLRRLPILEIKRK